MDLRGDHVMIAPPAVITAEEIRWAVEKLGEAIQEAASLKLPGKKEGADCSAPQPIEND